MSDELELTISTHIQESFERVTAERDKAMVENNRLRAELEAANTRAAEAMQKWQEAEEKWREDFDVRTALLAERDAAKAEVGRLTKQLEALEESEQMWMEQVTTTRQQVAELERERNALKTDNDLLHHQVVSLERERDKLHDDRGIIWREQAKVRVDLATTRQQLAEAERELEQFKTDEPKKRKELTYLSGIISNTFDAAGIHGTERVTDLPKLVHAKLTETAAHMERMRVVLQKLRDRVWNVSPPHHGTKEYSDALIPLIRGADDALSLPPTSAIAEHDAELLRPALEALERLAGYAATVRTDQRKTIEGDLFALQTMDWCEGLMEYVKSAESTLATYGAKP